MVYIFLTFILCIGAIGCSGQAFPTVKEFSAPAFPAVALAVRASGVIQVATLVDSNGKVVSAGPVSGHPLLKVAAGAAARKWTFSETPGSHFLILRFVFDLPTPQSKPSATLKKGSYTLTITEEMPRIKQVVSH